MLLTHGDGMDYAAHIDYRDITELLQRLAVSDLGFIKTENLYEIDGQRAYSLGQGE
jgi:isocitrate dehydrogenase